MYNPSTVAETIKKTASSHNIQVKTMLTVLNLNKNTLSNMYKGSMLKSDSLARIADYLGCSVDYLLGREEQQEKPAPEEGSGLSETAKKIMECVNQMSSQEQDAFLAWLQASQGRN